MIGRLVAVHIQDVDDFLQVTGHVAQAKNRKRAWIFKVKKDAAGEIPDLVEMMEERREAPDKA